MPTIAEDVILEEVEHILASGTGVLDFAVADEESYYTWWGAEDADWEVSDVESVENVEEDRMLIHPEKDFFRCEISAEDEEQNMGPVRCYCK